MSIVIDAAVGIDLGDRFATYVVYGQGVVLSRGKVRMAPGAFAHEFGGAKYKVVVIEAGAQSSWVNAELIGTGHRVVVANPRKVQLIAQNERKSDDRDPLLLAKLGYADESLLHPVTLRRPEHVAAMGVIVSRDAVVRSRTLLVNCIRAQAKAAGVRLGSGSPAKLRENVDLAPEELREVLLPMTSAVESMTTQIKTYDRRLTTLIDETFPEAKWLTQVTGVGPVTGLAYYLLIGDPKRFRTRRDVAAYLGLVPRRRESGADPQLRISKTGSGLVRRLLVQCAQYILGPFGKDCDLRRWGFALAERGGKNAKRRAIVAVARKLAVQLLTLWAGQLEWEPLHNANLLAACEASPASGDAPIGAPRSLVSDDCASPSEGHRDQDRGRDCSVTDGSDPSMRTGTQTPETNADRSVDAGASRTSEKQTKASHEPARSAERRPSRPRPTAPPLRPPTATVEAPPARRQGQPGAGAQPARSPGRHHPAARPPAPMEAPQEPRRKRRKA